MVELIVLQTECELGLITIIVAIQTVASQAYKAASLNPIKSLRYE
jgi:ABC-type antimicrobial peptide transport system permease subunit